MSATAARFTLVSASSAFATPGQSGWSAARPAIDHRSDVRATSDTSIETRAIASGDTEAFGRFYERWFDEVYVEARRLTRLDESFCLDVTQDVMMRVIKRIPSMETDAAVRSWLASVVRACAIDRLRAESRRTRRERALRRPTAREHDGELMMAPGVDAAEGEPGERIRWLSAELQHLDDPSRRLLELRFRFGWTLARIGETLGIKTGAVDGRINRVLESLRRKAREDFDGSA